MGSNRTKESPGRKESEATKIVPSGHDFATPVTALENFAIPANIAISFVDSVINLCSKSLASDAEISEPDPAEDMFYLTMRSCGFTEAKYWAHTLGLNCARPVALMETLLYGHPKASGADRSLSS